MGLARVGHRYDRSVTRHPAPYVNMTREVRDALVRGQPVVALETTYVSHGFPHPTGVETALASDAAVREGGAVPATIALMDGEIRVGLSEDDLGRIALEDPRKVSPRDLAATLADGALGATTVAGTLSVARLCGIHHAATGGIGGVHRDAERTFDVSADLTELARAQVCLVCSGAKSILDVPRTLEVLETLGVPVVGYTTGTLPLFYCRESEHEVPARVDDAVQAAALCRIHWELSTTAVLIANPPPAESALTREEADRLIDAGLAAAAAAGVTGQAVTPFVLAHIHAASGGPSERVNRDLIVANAGVAGAIAAAAAPA
jgi:pseudouridine-5'-phosphate glycosidase